MVQRHEELPRPQVLLGGEARVVEHRRGPDPHRLECVEHFFRASLPRPGRDPRPDIGRVLAPPVPGAERFVRAPAGGAHQGGQPFPLVLLGADDEHLPVAARIEPHRLVDGAVAAVVDAARVLPGGVVPAEQEGDGLLHGHVEMIALPGGARGAARGKRGDRRVESGLNQGVMAEGADRRPLPGGATTGDDVAPAAGVDQGEVVPLPAAAGAGESERGDRDDHQPGVAPAPDARVFEAGGETLPDQEVGAGEQPLEPGPAAVRRPVQDDASLVGVEVEKGAARSGAGAGNEAPPPEGVALRRLDLDHVGAEVRKDLSGARSREAPAQLDDPQAFEPLPHRRASPGIRHIARPGS